MGVGRDPGTHHGTWLLYGKKSMCFLSDSAHVRALMHAGIADKKFPFKSVAGKTFPAFLAHAQLAILRIAILRIW